MKPFHNAVITAWPLQRPHTARSQGLRAIALALAAAALGAPTSVHSLGLGKAIGEAAKADAVLISCGGLLTLGCAEPIERRHGIPVVTSTQSAFWKAMRLAGDSGHVAGRGRMLAQSAAVPA